MVAMALFSRHWNTLLRTPRYFIPLCYCRWFFLLTEPPYHLTCLHHELPTLTVQQLPLPPTLLILIIIQHKGQYWFQYLLLSPHWEFFWDRLQHCIHFSIQANILDKPATRHLTQSQDTYPVIATSPSKGSAWCSGAPCFILDNSSSSHGWPVQECAFISRPPLQDGTVQFNHYLLTVGVCNIHR